MRFLARYKTIYILVLVANFLVVYFNLHHRRYIQVSEHRIELAINVVAIAINLVSWFGYRKGRTLAYICERLLSIGRILVALIFATAVFVPLVILAPTFEVLWLPLMGVGANSEWRGSTWVYVPIWISAAVIFTLEVIYFRLLKKYRAEYAGA